MADQNRSITTIYVFVMRHGKKDPEGGTNALLTAKGREQVAEVASQFLGGMSFDLLFSSTLDRAAETAEIAYASASGEGVHIARYADRREELGFLGLPDHEFADGLKNAKAKSERGEIVTVADWLKWAPEYMIEACVRFRTEIAQIALDTITGNGKNSLIGCHSPLAELGSTDPRTPTLGEAGLIRYTVSVDLQLGMVEITDTKVIFEGF